MSIQHVRFNSKCLKRPAHFNLILPNDTPSWFFNDNPSYNRPTKTLVLLHGYGEDEYTWITDFNISQLAYINNMAVVLPAGENGFYVDSAATGMKYATLIGEEIIEYVRKNYNLATKKEDTFIAGYSMGGYGAQHIAFQFPQTFSACAGLSSAIIQHSLKPLKPGEDNSVANYDYYYTTFGELSKIDTNDKDLEFQVKQLKEKGVPLPRIYCACGTEDFLLNENRAMHAFYEKEGIAHEYLESTGAHDMRFWSQYLPKFVEWVLKTKSAE